MNKSAFVILLALALGACKDANEPPDMADWFHPTIENQTVEIVDYVKKYCTGTQAHVNCVKANTAFQIAIGEKDPVKQKEKFAIAFPNK